MKILFLVPYAPTLIRTRPYNLVRGLLRRGHTITLATLWETEQEHESLRQLEQPGLKIIAAHLSKKRALWNSAWALPTDFPLQAFYCWQPTLLRMVDHHLKREYFDIIHIEHLRGVRYGLWMKYQLAKSPIRPPMIWDSVDCISHLFEQAVQSSRSIFGRLITRLELGRTRRYEGWLIGQFTRVLVTSSADKIELEKLAASHNASKEDLTKNSNRISIVPNGVDLEFFAPTQEPREPDTIVFSGKMSYHANVTAASYLVNDIMPLVWERNPNVRVWIVGKDPSPEVLQFAIRHPLHVTVTGTVPDIRPYLARASVSVCPVRYGAGIQNKVLEAMAMATPVVATSQAVSALQVCKGEHVLIGDTADSFAEMLLQALENPELRAKIGTAGHQYVQEHHNWNTICEQLESLYETLSVK